MADELTPAEIAALDARIDAEQLDEIDADDDEEVDEIEDEEPDDLGQIKALAKELGITVGQLRGRLEASRKWERRAKENATAARNLEKLRRSGLPADEQRIEDAKAQARAEAKAEYSAAMVEAHVRSRAAGRLSEEALDALIEGVDRSRFVDEDGDVDTAKVSEWLDRVAPAKGNSNTKRIPDTGQGKRSGTGKATGVAAGRELYESTRPKTTANA